MDDQGRNARLSAHSEGPPLVWVADVPLLTNPVILFATAAVLSLTYLLIVLVFVFVLGFSGDLDRLGALMGAMLVGMAVLAGLILFVMAVLFGNRMRCRFVLDEHGFSSVVIDRRAELGASLAALGGTASHDLTLAGAGLSYQAGKGEYTPWKRVSAVRFRPDRKEISMTAAGWWPIGSLYCSDDVYLEVADRVVRIARSRGIRVALR